MAGQIPPISTNYLTTTSSNQTSGSGPRESSGPGHPFTPRSTTFPDDNYDSDEGSTVFVPTPIHSPGGPRYDDLPPSYDEAQREALEQARAGIHAPSGPNDLDVHRLVLDDRHTETRDGTQRTSSLLDDPNAYELEPEEKSSADSVGLNEFSRDQALNSASEHSLPLLSHALEFTKHEPDADVRYAPRLTRCIAIPQELSSISAPEPEGKRLRRRRGCDDNEHRSRGKGRHRHTGEGHGRGRNSHDYPSAASHYNAAPEEDGAPTQFLRAYSKALHTHSIHPGEFADFIDGLNAICQATQATPATLSQPPPSPDAPEYLVHSYINATNEAFFAPRGLRVSLKPLSSLLSSLNIPEERGQRAGAIATASDTQASAEQRAMGLYPWIEKLEPDLPAVTPRMTILREMGERFQELWIGRPGDHSGDDTCPRAGVADNSDVKQADDPPHSVPSMPARSDQADCDRGPGGPFGGPGFPSPWGGHQRGGWMSGGGLGRGPGRCSWGGGREYGWNRGHHWGGHQAGWGFNHCIDPLGHHRGPGRGRQHGFGWDPHNSWSHHGGGLGAQRGCQGPGGPQSWASWGEALGKWGEEFGKRMGEMGEQFGKRMEAAGEELGSRVEEAATGHRPSTDRSRQQAQDSGIIREATTYSEKQKAKMETENTGAKAEKEIQKAEKDAEKIRAKAEKKIQKAEKHADKTMAKAEKMEKKRVSDYESNDSDSDSDSDSSSLFSVSSSDSFPPNASHSIEDPLTTLPTQLFTQRLLEINAQASVAASKGKKPASVIASERSAAIAVAESEKTALEAKIERKKLKWELMKEFKMRKRELREGHRERKREIRERGGGKGEKRREKREYREEKRKERREYKEERGALRSEGLGALREWKGRGRRGERGWDGGKVVDVGETVWIVVENLGD